jgi:hypothetical protein
LLVRVQISNTSASERYEVDLSKPIGACGGAAKDVGFELCVETENHDLRGSICSSYVRSRRNANKILEPREELSFEDEIGDECYELRAGQVVKIHATVVVSVVGNESNDSNAMGREVAGAVETVVVPSEWE